MNEFGDYALMDGLHSNTNIRYHQSVCIKLSTFEKSCLFILFYSILLPVAHTLSLVRSLLSIDPSMTSEERRGERDVEREGFAAEKFSFVFGYFWCFFLLLDYII